ncbi:MULTISPECIES: helix-turn-helix domain-containing protein [Luteimonas]|uniref:helix-turn-helix domain-containing protein n=1 Tax=Luteimonas TaxID=83614 RepID=UPI000C7D0493|nr:MULTISPECIES: helix-turn-helix domain-containing protein [Luteimonas]
MSASNQTASATPSGVGEQLRHARERADWSVAEVASRLRMQIRVVEALERENWARLGAPVFVRGQLRSYLRLLKLPESLADTVSDATQVSPPTLTPRTYTPPMQRMLDKAMGRAVYVVITALIAVPVWMAARPHLGMPTVTEVASLGIADGDDATAATPADAEPRGPTALTASLANLPKRTPAAAPAAVPETTMLELRFSGQSWINISAPDGAQVEQALMQAGEQRRFEADDVGRMVLGNAGAVELLRDGVVQDLSRFKRADVARFTVSSDGVLAPVAE